MKTVEVKRDSWGQFCQRLSDSRNGSLVRVRLVSEAGTEELVVERAPLRGVEFDPQSNDCSNLIIITAGEQGGRAFQHLVVEPIHVRLKNGDNQRFNHLHLLAESGTTIIDLYPGLTPADLDGLALE